MTYRGIAPFASMLVQMLEDEGVTVADWERPEEARGAGADALRDVVVGLVTSGAYDAIKFAIERFRTAAKGRGHATIDGDPDDGGFF
ncbi:hypothetical protein [Pedococcus sp. 5OH_020]|uniref:hypothetical protein n=1 Tax=Pedococcus sp. 5OH_020 TaxID=2989814 RepID=UPI0022E9CEAA|nr:hypothetical protein [Pedococcus sp. 5OH_020]